MKEDSQLLNLSDLDVKRKLMSRIGSLTGLYEVILKPRKRTRSLDQNAYYWVAVATPFRDWLREEYGDPSITAEQAHEMLKVKILGFDEKLIEGTGEVLKLIPRSNNKDTKEFSDYIEGCAAWLAEFCAIIILPPDVFFEKKD